MEPDRRDREWENWPGQGVPDGSVRGRLRGLFSPTDEAESEIEEIIEARGRDLELRTAELTSTIGDLQRREEETRELRGEIEEMLREGAEELDQRHAQLSALSAETIRREAELQEVEKALEERRQELGAVELRRAAVERREASLSTQQTELERIREELAARVTDAEERVSELDRRRADIEERAAELAARTTSSMHRRQSLRSSNEARRPPRTSRPRARMTTPLTSWWCPERRTGSFIATGCRRCRASGCWSTRRRIASSALAVRRCPATAEAAPSSNPCPAGPVLQHERTERCRNRDHGPGGEHPK